MKNENSVGYATLGAPDKKDVSEHTMTYDEFCSFGELLRAFRTRSHLTQQQLARAIGLHRNAISRWEQGNFLPRGRSQVLELARKLHLDYQDTRKLLEASLIAFAHTFVVPWPRNPYFTGREKLLSALHARLGIDQQNALTQCSAVHGLGGVGKTQIALEYAYRHALEYSAVFWVDAGDNERTIASLLTIAEVLQMPERESTDPQHVVLAVQHWLSSHAHWLLIWDDARDQEMLQRFLPAKREGSILLTTRGLALGTLAQGLDLAPMEQREAILFVLRRAKVLDLQANDEHVLQFADRAPAPYRATTELVAMLGGLPLALDQAGAYLEETRCGLPAYVELFRKESAALLSLRGRSDAHPAAVSTMFRLSATATIALHPAAGDFLHVCALLSAHAIPEELFRQGGLHLGARLQATCSNSLEWNRLVSAVCSYSLLSRQPEEQTLAIHRLAQAVLLDAMSETERQQWMQHIIAALAEVFPSVQSQRDQDMWKQAERLLPHVLVCLGQAGGSQASPVLASLAYKSARYFSVSGREVEAEAFYQRAISIQEQALGPEHPALADPLTGLAMLYARLGRYADAEPLYQRALPLLEHAAEPERPGRANACPGAAMLYSEQSWSRQADALFHRTFSTRGQVLVPDRLALTSSLTTLAGLYSQQGRYRQAEQLLQRVWHLLQHALGPTHPEVGSAISNLALTIGKQGRYEEADALYQRALPLMEHLGPGHPEVACVLINLADLRREQGRAAEAEALYYRALSLWKQHFGSDHLGVAPMLTGLAGLRREQDRDAEADALYLRALLIQKQAWDLRPDVAQTLYGLALFRQQQGKRSEAFILARRALAICSQTLGNTHPQTIAARTLHTQLAEERADGLSQEQVTHHDNLLRKGADDRQVPRSSHPTDSFPDMGKELFDAFLAGCCELHPRAWCHSTDLWQAYVHWSQERRERFPLSRRTFVAHLRAQGCQADRTSTARVWRGVALRSSDQDKR